METITTISRTTTIGNGFLTGVYLNGSNQTNSVALSTLTYSAGLLMNFDTLSVSSSAIYYFTNLGLNHNKLFVRLNAKS